MATETENAAEHYLRTHEAKLRTALMTVMAFSSLADKPEDALLWKHEFNALIEVLQSLGLGEEDDNVST